MAKYVQYDWPISNDISIVYEQLMRRDSVI